MFDDDDSVFAAVRGARGYVLKGALKTEVVRAVRSINSGDAIFGATIARKMMVFPARVRRAAATFS